MTKIAFLLGSTSSNGGIERATSVLANKISEEGIAVVFAIGFHPRREERVYKWHKNIRFHDLLDKEESMKTGIFKGIPKLRKFLKRNDINILISCGHIYAPLGGMACLTIKTRFVYWSHSSFYGESNAFKRLNEVIGGILSNTLICLTKADIKNYERKTFAKKVVQIYNPLDEELTLMKSKYNPETKKIISVGRLADPKNFESYLLQVAEMFLHANPEYTWHIYGKGPLESIIREKINQMRLGNKVFLEGNVDNLYELYPNYSIMVMTSSYEGFPMTLLEGMAMSIPLVSFDIQTGPNEIIEDGVNGFLISPFNIDEMAEKLTLLAKDEKLRMEMSRSNSLKVADFHLKNTIAKWASVISEQES